MNDNDFDLEIEPSEQTPVVTMLLSVIETLRVQLANQGEQLTKQSEKVDLLLSEIRRLKHISEKPKIRASKLPKNNDDNDDVPPTGNDTPKKRAGSAKRSKRNVLKIDKEEIIAVANVPVGSVRKGYQDYVVQDLIISTQVIKYRLERWQFPDGNHVTATLPKEITGHHFGPTLRTYILHQHHHQCVTQPLLLAQLREWKIDMSVGQLNRLLVEDKVKFHDEKDAILKSGLSVSEYIQVDDTGARHKGVNGYCTFIGNDLFSWFSSTASKSRINFLELLRGDQQDYQLTAESFAYMERYQVTPWVRRKLHQSEVKKFIDANSWGAHLAQLNITNKHYIRIVTEAVLIGSILSHGFSNDTIILSDDAGQFNVFKHALCWIHAERGIKSLIAGNEVHQKAVDWARNEVWEIYRALLDYKCKPDVNTKNEIEKRFDTFCKTKTNYYSLDLVLQRLYKNKDELLLVLEHPEIPLHNNLSERDIREYVKRRKISGSTRSDDGRRCRDTFASLKKTALKLGIGFWDFLIDRIYDNRTIPLMSELVLNASRA